MNLKIWNMPLRRQLNNMKKRWLEINSIFENEVEFLGVDSSIVPLFRGNSSLVNFVKKLRIFSE